MLNEKERAAIVKLAERVKAEKDGNHRNPSLCREVRFDIGHKHEVSLCWSNIHAGISFARGDSREDHDADLNIGAEGADDYIKTCLEIIKLLTAYGLKQTSHGILKEECDWIDHWHEGCDNFVPQEGK